MNLTDVDQDGCDYRRSLLQTGGLDAAVLRHPESVARGHRRNLSEVIYRRRRRRRPFECPRVPGIGAGALAGGEAPVDIEQQRNEREGDYIGIPGLPLVPEVPAHMRRVCIDAAGHPEIAEEM